MGDTILIVEDEEDLAATVAYNLAQSGFEPRIAHTGADGLARALAAPLPVLVLLDLMLPDLSGVEVCRRLREDPRTSQIPVVMLTARGDEIDRVIGFEVGADDYVVKPFSVRELMLRVRAVLRRGQVAAPPAQELRFGTIRMDLSAYRVWVGDDEVTLTALEFKLLEVFIRRRGRVQTRGQLLEDVWDMRADVATRTVDTHVKRLRQKLGDVGKYIETLRGVGYRLDDEAIRG